MTSNSLIYLVLAGGITIWAIVIFNRLVRDKNRVLAAWSDIDVQLKRRHDLIPKLVDAVKQYAAFEKATLEGVTALRTRAKQVQDLGPKTWDQLGKQRYLDYGTYAKFRGKIRKLEIN